MEEALRLNITGVNLTNGFKSQDMGYPTASANIAKAMQTLGVNISAFDTSAKVNLSFAVPTAHVLFSNSYNILYSSHETTEISDVWAKCLLKGDEV